MTEQPPATPAPLKIGIVGLGLHGRGIAELALSQGFTVSGAVDIGDRIGTALSDTLTGCEAGAAVHGSLEDLCATGIDVAILTPATSVDVVLDMARTALLLGTNVLTIHADLFARDVSWTAALEAAAQSGNASFLATGVQDTWWVQMPAVAAGSTLNLRGVALTHVVDVNSLSAEVGRMIGVGLDEASFIAQYSQAESEERPILGDPLREAARKMGLTLATDPVTTVQPVLATGETLWVSGERLLQPGEVIGSVELTSFTTTSGAHFTSSLRTIVLGEGEHPSDEVLIDADPTLRLSHTPFPGDRITNVAAVNRIRDVYAAAPGVYTAAELAPARSASLPA